MEFLWPWQQHLEALSLTADENVAALGYSEEDSDYEEAWNNQFFSLLENYFNSRQKCDGCLPVEYDSY